MPLYPTQIRLEPVLELGQSLGEQTVPPYSFTQSVASSFGVFRLLLGFTIHYYIFEALWTCHIFLKVTIRWTDDEEDAENESTGSYAAAEPPLPVPPPIGLAEESDRSSDNQLPSEPSPPPPPAQDAQELPPDLPGSNSTSDQPESSYPLDPINSENRSQPSQVPQLPEEALTGPGSTWIQERRENTLTYPDPVSEPSAEDQANEPPPDGLLLSPSSSHSATSESPLFSHTFHTAEIPAWSLALHDNEELR